MQMGYQISIDGIINFIRRAQSCDCPGGTGNILDECGLVLLREEKQFRKMIIISNYAAPGIKLVTHQVEPRNTKSHHKKH